MSDTVARNEPCPCGSGKKYKRCCGVDAAPKLGVPKQAVSENPDVQEFLSKVPQDTMAQMQDALKRMPKAQLRKLQELMARAMRGEDVSKEMAILEKQLPKGLGQDSEIEKQLEEKVDEGAFKKFWGRITGGKKAKTGDTPGASE